MRRESVMWRIGCAWRRSVFAPLRLVPASISRRIRDTELPTTSVAIARDRYASTTSIWMPENTIVSSTTRAQLTKLLRCLRTVAWLAVVVMSQVAARAGEEPPIFTVEPVNTTVRRGEMATFSAQAAGSTPLTISWYRNGLAVTGSSTSIVTAPVCLADDGALFSVTFSNIFGIAGSSNALLRVEPGIVAAASVNHSVNGGLYRGWPLVLEVALLHPQSFVSNAVPILISGTNGPWFNALQVDVRDAQEQLQL